MLLSAVCFLCINILLYIRRGFPGNTFLILYSSWKVSHENVLKSDNVRLDIKEQIEHTRALKVPQN